MLENIKYVVSNCDMFNGICSVLVNVFFKEGNELKQTDMKGIFSNLFFLSIEFLLLLVLSTNIVLLATFSSAFRFAFVIHFGVDRPICEPDESRGRNTDH